MVNKLHRIVHRTVLCVALQCVGCGFADIARLSDIGMADNVLTNTDLLTDTIAEYSEAYGTHHGQLFSLIGVLFVGDSWVIWVNNKEICRNDKPSIRIGGKDVEIVQVTPRAVSVVCEGREIVVSVGRSYDLVANEFTDI